MRKIIIWAGIFSFVALAIAGCSGNIEESKQVAQAYIKSFDTNDPEFIKSFYAPELRQYVDTTDHVEKLLRLHDRLGEFQSLELVGLMDRRHIGRGTSVEITFKVSYANYQMMERVILIPTDPGDSIKILDHAFINMPIDFLIDDSEDGT